jgi:hypothetical protein
MFSSLFKLSIALITVFAASIGLIRAQPHDTAAIRDFLAPPQGCEMPCFIGICPGETTLDESMRILSQHQWISGVNVPGEFDSVYRSGFIYWHWSGEEPAFIDITRSSRLRVYRGVVDSISIQTNTTFGEIWMSLDMPEHGELLFSASEYLRMSALHDAIYWHGALSVQSVIRCPLTLQGWWEAPITLEVRDPSSIRLPALYDLPRLLDTPYCAR